MTPTFIFSELNQDTLRPTLITDFETKVTFLAGKLMTITALHVIPFIVVFHTKCVHAVFFFEVVRLVLGPSCKVSRFTIHPSKVTLRGDVIQTQPGFFSIVAVLYVNIFFVIADVSKDGVFLSAFCQSCGPVCTFFTRKVTESIEIGPAMVTDICKYVEKLSVICRMFISHLVCRHSGFLLAILSENNSIENIFIPRFISPQVSNQSEKLCPFFLVFFFGIG